MPPDLNLVFIWCNNAFSMLLVYIRVMSKWLHQTRKITNKFSMENASDIFAKGKFNRCCFKLKKSRQRKPVFAIDVRALQPTVGMWKKLKMRRRKTENVWNNCEQVQVTWRSSCSSDLGSTKYWFPCALL